MNTLGSQNRCGYEKETERFGTVSCGRHEGHEGQHSDLKPAGVVVYEWGDESDD